MINLYEKLGYKTGRSLTSCLNKVNKALVERYKPYERLDYKDCVEILSSIQDVVPKTKSKILGKLLEEYKQNVEDGLTAKKPKVQKQKVVIERKKLEMTKEWHKFDIHRELKLEYPNKNQEDFASVYMYAMKVLHGDRIAIASREFIGKKVWQISKTKKEYDFNYLMYGHEFRYSFCNLIKDIPKYNIVHIEDMIYFYKFVSNTKSYMDVARPRSKALELLVEHCIENDEKENDRKSKKSVDKKEDI